MLVVVGIVKYVVNIVVVCWYLLVVNSVVVVVGC